MIQFTMNQVKYILLLLISFFISCSDSIKNNDTLSLSFDFTNKELNRLYYGNKYYRINGINYKTENNDFTLKKPQGVLLLESKNDFIHYYNDIALLEKPCTLFLHDFGEIKSLPIDINFNHYIDNKFYLQPIFSTENMELLKNRSAKIYSLENITFLSPYFIDEFNYENNSLLLKDIIIHSQSLENLNNLIEIGLYPSTYKAIKFIYNPLSGLYSLFPDLRYFSKTKTNIHQELKKNLISDNIDFTSSVYLNYEIKNDTIISKNLVLNRVNFKVNEGVEIKLQNNSKIIIKDSKIKFNGGIENMIKVKGYGDNSIIFSNSNDVQINYSSFEGLSNLVNDSLTLPSALTFYNSNVKINNSKFSNNFRGDDLINFYNSYFEIQNSLFVDVLADGLDSDFSDGFIKNSKFYNIGNDALDFSGSHVEINNVEFKIIKDKAVSAGENSKINILNSSISESDLALVVKDGSVLSSTNNVFENNQIDYCAFLKKSFYKKPNLNIDVYNNEKYLFQEGVNVYSSNQNLFQKVADVESLLYGNIYGRSSK